MAIPGESRVSVLGVSVAAMALAVGYFAKPAYAITCTSEKCTFHAPPYSWEGTCGVYAGEECACFYNGAGQPQLGCNC